MKAKCKLCGDTVEVTRPKEFKSCKCGAISLDYGDEYYYRVGGNPENFDGEIEDVPEILDRGVDIIGEENIGGESGPVGKADKFAEQAREYFNTAVKVKESFMNVNVNLCEGGSYDRYKATFYEDEVLAIAHCLNFTLGMVEEGQKKGHKPFITQGELETIVDVANKCNQLVSQLPKEQA